MIDELDMNKRGSGWNIIFDGTSNSPPCTISFFVLNPQNAIFANLDRKVLAPNPWLLVCNGSYTFLRIPFAEKTIIYKLYKTEKCFCPRKELWFNLYFLDILPCKTQFMFYGHLVCKKLTSSSFMVFFSL